MKLPDFLAFEPFNDLRQRMGAVELGHFDLFDPKIQLSTHEREALASVGLAIAISSVRALDDLTLAYKDGRVAVFTEEQNGCFHVSNCADIQALGEQKAKFKVATVEPLPSPSSQVKVCEDCLQRLRYEGFDMNRHRHRQYSEGILSRFTLTKFFSLYSAYPIKMNDTPQF